MMNKPFRIRGVIEGFYGVPWTFDHRFTLLERMNRWGLNTYMYAPKFDIKHRLKWAEPYSENELHHFKDLINRAISKGINVIFSVSPGLSFDMDNPRDEERLRDKLQKFIDIGATSLAILLDDIPYHRANCGDHIKLLHGLMKGFSSHVEWFFCPTAYSNWHLKNWAGAEEYLNRLGKDLNSEVSLFWTGPTIISREITRMDIDPINDIVKRKIVLWDNFTADDYTPAHTIFPGPVTGRASDLDQSCAGILLNPSQYFYISLLSIETLSDYVSDPGHYHPHNSWQSVIDRTFPDKSGLLTMVLGYFYTPADVSEEWLTLLNDIHQWFLKSCPMGNHSPEDRIRTLLTLIKKDENLLDYSPLWEEIFRHVQTLVGDLEYLFRAVERIRSGLIEPDSIFPSRDRRWSSPINLLVNRLKDDL